MSPIRALLAVTLLGILGGNLANAEVLDMRSVGAAPPNSPEGVPRPTRGMSMEQVRARFGDPIETRGPVGEPPITRWTYDRYTVVFEHQYVIHSVVHADQR